MKYPDKIFQFIEEQENGYLKDIWLNDKWSWNMKTHIDETVIYKHSQLTNDKGKNTENEKPVKNIIKPILNLEYRAEDIDVKDIILYIDDPDKYYLSFLVKKYHDDVFVIENDMDTFWDIVKEEKIDFGGSLIMDTGNAKPEVIPMQSIVFCDQTDLMSGPIGIKYFLSPSQLKEMAKKNWGNKNYGADVTIDELLELAMPKKITDRIEGVVNDTPGKYVEVYMVLGDLPLRYLEETDKEEYVYQMQIVAFYTTKNLKNGVTLFKAEIDNPLKIVKRDPIYGRALGWGGVEELIEPQVWTNYSMIRIKEMQDAASKTLLKSTDPQIMAKHPTGLKSMDNLEIVQIENGTDLGQVDTFPRNLQLFDKSVQEWWEHAQIMGSAHDPQLGLESKSGTPFRAQERQVIEGNSIHEYRRGKFAKFIEEVYRDWIIPHISKQIAKDQKFLSELSMDEMQEVSEKVAISEVNKIIKERILNGELINKDEIEALKQQYKERFIKSGNKKFIEIVKDEMKGIELKIKINVAGKQKYLAARVEGLVNIFRQVFSNPQLLTYPPAAKIFNQILESSGFSPVDFSLPLNLPAQPTPQPQPMGAINAPVETNAV